MVRIKASVARKLGRKRLFKATKGYYGQKKNRYVQAIKASIRAMRYSSEHRKQRGREFRSLWIVRINALCRENGIAYSRLIRGLKAAEITINRKMLAEIAINDPKTFIKILEIAKKALPAGTTNRKVITN
jgi:large subunit ribosomal protein L20